VSIDPPLQLSDSALVQSASVTFEPRARTAGRTHLLGKILVVTLAVQGLAADVNTISCSPSLRWPWLFQVFDSA